MSVRNILLVEDDERDVEMTLMAFRNHNLVNLVHVVRDGEEALDYLFRRGAYEQRPPGEPCVVLLDIKLPKVSGLDVLAQVRESPEFKFLPIVLLTSSREHTDLVHAYKLGANAFVVKPVKFQEFLAAAQKIGAFWALLNEPLQS